MCNCKVFVLDILFALKTASDVCYSVVIYSTLYSYVLYYTVIRCLSSVSFLVFSVLCVCVCVCACVRACVRACVHACVRESVFILCFSFQQWISMCSAIKS